MVVTSSMKEFLELDIKCNNPSCRKGPYEISILWNSNTVMSRHNGPQNDVYCSSVCKDKCLLGWSYGYPYRQKKGREAVEGEETCYICFINVPTERPSSNCEHMMCPTCVNTLTILGQRKCPICRKMW